MPNFYHRDGTFAVDRCERMFDPEIWRDVTGGEVAERVRRLTRVTPLVPAPALGRRTGADVWLKLENLQRTGSFKLRGAAARIAALALQAGGGPKPQGDRRLGRQPRPGRRAGRARISSVDATVLVSAQTPEVKRAGIAALGARVEVAGATYDEAEAVARAARRRRSRPGVRVGVRRRPRDRRQRRPAGARDPGPAPRRAGDRRPRRGRRPGGRHRRRGRPARHQAAGRVARGQLRDAPLARRGPRLHDLRRRPDAGRGPGGRGQRAHLRDGARLLPRHRAGQRAADPRGDRLRLPHAGHHVRGVGGARAGRAARRRQRRSAAAAPSSSSAAATSSPICSTSC